ncbi:unnamed protein product, partial [Amoebophrya sp. A25]
GGVHTVPLSLPQLSVEELKTTVMLRPEERKALLADREEEEMKRIAFAEAEGDGQGVKTIDAVEEDQAKLDSGDVGSDQNRIGTPRIEDDGAATSVEQLDS